MNSQVTMAASLNLPIMKAPITASDTKTSIEINLTLKDEIAVKAIGSTPTIPTISIKAWYGKFMCNSHLDPSASNSRIVLTSKSCFLYLIKNCCNLIIFPLSLS